MALTALKIRNFSIILTLRRICFELYKQTSEYSEHSLSTRTHGTTGNITQCSHNFDNECKHQS